MTTATAWIQEIRAPFLILTPVSVFVGAAVAAWDGFAINAGYLALAMVGALLAHIAVNVINEYYDYQSGVDFKTVRTPFSGGSGILVQGLVSPRAAFMLGIACIAAILGIGWYFFTVHGAGIIPLGILGVIVLYFYTTHITKSPLLCAIAPGLGFGPLMVMGTYFSLTGTYSLAAGLASIVPAFLVSNLLLLNQFPDVEADTLVNRRHLPIVIGREKSSLVYAALLAGAYVALIASVAVGVLPPLALLGLITLPLGWMAVQGARRYYDQIEKLVPIMGKNVVVTLTLPLLMAVGIVIAVVIG